MSINSIQRAPQVSIPMGEFIVAGRAPSGGTSLINAKKEFAAASRLLQKLGSSTTGTVMINGVINSAAQVRNLARGHLQEAKRILDAAPEPKGNAHEFHYLKLDIEKMLKQLETTPSSGRRQVPAQGRPAAGGSSPKTEYDKIYDSLNKIDFKTKDSTIVETVNNALRALKSNIRLSDLTQGSAPLQAIKKPSDLKEDGRFENIKALISQAADIFYMKKYRNYDDPRNNSYSSPSTPSSTPAAPKSP